MKGARLLLVALVVAATGAGCKSSALRPPVDAATDGDARADGARDAPFDGAPSDAASPGDARASDGADAADVSSGDTQPGDVGSAADTPDADAGGPLSILLLPDGTGFISSSVTGPTHIQGSWYGYSDGAGADGLAASGTCERAGHPAAACSRVTMPAAGSFPNVGGKMCTSGVAAQVVAVDGGFLDYQNIAGAGIAVDLNVIVPAGTVLPYDARANGVVGLAFDIDAVPLSGLQIGFPTPATAHDPAFWGGDAVTSPVRAGHNEVRWPAVLGPYYNLTAVAFDPTMILSMRFHVPTATTASTPYSFCVSNLAALLR